VAFVTPRQGVVEDEAFLVLGDVMHHHLEPRACQILHATS